MTSGNAVEALSYTGLDFIILDAEHGTVEAETAEDLIRAAKLHNLTPFVRVKDCSRPAILKMLEAGAHGLVIPQIHTPEEVRRAVEYGSTSRLGCGGYLLESTAAMAMSLLRITVCRITLMDATGRP